MDVLGRAMKKRLFGGGYTVSPFSVVFASVSAFQKGALLAYSRADQYERLCALISDQAESQAAEVARKVARELEHLRRQFDVADRLYPSISVPRIDFTDVAQLKSMARGKMRLGETSRVSKSLLQTEWVSGRHFLMFSARCGRIAMSTQMLLRGRRPWRLASIFLQRQTCTPSRGRAIGLT